jgi:hypothetical protein
LSTFKWTKTRTMKTKMPFKNKINLTGHLQNSLIKAKIVSTKMLKKERKREGLSMTRKFTKLTVMEKWKIFKSMMIALKNENN